MDAILSWTVFFRKLGNENKHVALSLLDLSKAFDSINHEYLKNTLNDLGFSESAIKMIHSFINKR